MTAHDAHLDYEGLVRGFGVGSLLKSAFPEKLVELAHFPRSLSSVASIPCFLVPALSERNPTWTAWIYWNHDAYDSSTFQLCGRLAAA